MSIEIRHFSAPVAYGEAFRLQEDCLRRVLEEGHPGFLLLLEHPDVFTIGRTRDQSSLGDPAGLPFPVKVINRGGQATWHGPGQLVGYPVIDLGRRGRDLHRYLRFLEEALIVVLAEDFGLRAGRSEGLTGVWAGSRKIASLGVGVRKWVTMHGFALNVCPDLAAFGAITPCGIAGVEMTSVARETGRAVGVGEVREAVSRRFCGLLEEWLPLAGGEAPAAEA